MKLLALDTATEACSVALRLDDGTLIERTEVAGRTHSIRLPEMFDAVLAEAGLKPSQLDGLICGVGPGSFAGVRIGVSFVKGLALGLDRPVAPVSSLAMLAQAMVGSAVPASSELPVIAAIDARMGEVYVGRYRRIEGGLCLEGAEKVCPPAACGPPPVGPFGAVGTGWGAHADAMVAVLGRPQQLDGAALPQARDALILAAPDFAARAIDARQLVPAYLRNRVALTSAEQAQSRR